MAGLRQNECYAKGHQGIGQQKEQKLFHGQDTAQHQPDRFLRADGPNTANDGDGIGYAKVDCQGDNHQRDRSPVAPKNI